MGEIEEITRRLKRVEGQIRGLQRMVEDERDCEAVLTQLMAARAALDRVGLLIAGDFLRDCAWNPDGSLEVGTEGIAPLPLCPVSRTLRSVAAPKIPARRTACASEPFSYHVWMHVPCPPRPLGRSGGGIGGTPPPHSTGGHTDDTTHGCHGCLSGTCSFHTPPSSPSISRPPSVP